MGQWPVAPLAEARGHPKVRMKVNVARLPIILYINAWLLLWYLALVFFGQSHSNWTIINTDYNHHTSHHYKILLLVYSVLKNKDLYIS